MSYKKNLVSLKAFLDPLSIGIIDIIKYCNLNHTTDWSEWIDDYGNLFKIIDKNNFTIKLNSDIDNQTINTKDLYIKSHINELVNFSKFSLISISDDSYFIWLLDNNNILRLYQYADGIFIGSQPVLLSSTDTLKKIIRNINVDSFHEVYHITEPASKKEANKAWATQLPMNEKLVKLLPEVLQKDLKFNA
jgi:hypothetical protein